MKLKKRENVRNNNLSPKDHTQAKAQWVKTLLRHLVPATDFLFNCITTILAIALFVNIGNIGDWRNHVKSRSHSPKAATAWEEDLSDLRVGYSRQFIESKLGDPRLTEEISFHSSTYSKCTYINSYFTLSCIYQDDSSLLGFLIIGNDSLFNFKNYRCDISLFDFTINEAEEYCYAHGLSGDMLIKSFFSQRLDTNSYYFECNYQHSDYASLSYYIGYGVCDIGAIESYEDFYKSAKSMYTSGAVDESYSEFREASINDAIRDCPINTFLVMSELPSRDNYTSNTVEFIGDYLISTPALGMSRDEYANYQANYEECIEGYLSYLDIKDVN